MTFWMKICLFSIKILQMKLSNSLSENMEIFKKVVGRNSDLIVRDFTLGRPYVIPAAIIYFENLIDSNQVDASILQPLLTGSYTSGLKTGAEIIKDIQLGNLITRTQIHPSENVKELLDGLVSGNVLLFIDGLSEVYMISTN